MSTRVEQHLGRATAVLLLGALGGWACSGSAGPDGGTAHSATSEVGATGGTLSLQGLVLTIPAGALSSTTSLTVTATADPAPVGYSLYSPVYRFEPAGLSFAQPATLALPFAGEAALATLYWSRSAGPGYDRLDGTTSGESVTATVTHFSTGFVASRLDAGQLDAGSGSCTASVAPDGGPELWSQGTCAAGQVCYFGRCTAQDASGVACFDDTDCPAPALFYCDMAASVCRAACRTTADCSAAVRGPFALPSCALGCTCLQGLCVP